jgi:predicted nucleotidyltransferase
MNGRAELLDPSTAVRAAVLADPRVRSVELIGSRATGTATELSDWDYRIASPTPVLPCPRYKQQHRRTRGR